MSLMILEDGLSSFLLQSADLTSIVSPSGIYLNAVSESAPDPCMSITLISAQPESGFSGPLGMNSRRYQFAFFSKDIVTCLKLQEQCRRVIEGFQGTLPNGQQVYNIYRDNELGGFDDLTSWHHLFTDYFIQFAD